MNENTAQPLTRDDVRAIVSEEIGKVGDLLLLGGHLVASDGCLQGLNSGAKFRNDRAQRIWLAGLNDLVDPIGEVPSDSHVFRQRSAESESGISKSHETSPSVDDAGAHSVGDGPGAGDASATPAAEVTDPHISARYDAPLNAIAMSVGGTDDLYFDRDATFLLVDELRAALHEQAKNGGLA